MPDLHSLTLHIGPQTAVGRELNTCARLARKMPHANGLLALPNRIATRSLRHLMLSDEPIEYRQAAFQTSIANDDKPVFLSALHVLGAPQTAFQKDELFPDAEVTLARLAALITRDDVRIVITLDALHRFFLAAASKPLEARVRSSQWEKLYDLSWAELVREVHVAFPSAQIEVLTPKPAAVQSARLLEAYFGPDFTTAVDPHLLTRLCLSENGQKALDELIAAAGASPEALDHLVSEHPAHPDGKDVETRLGIEAVTAVLLDQQFDADLREIEAMPGIHVL